MDDKVIRGDRVFLTPIMIEDSEDFVRWRNSKLVKDNFIYRKEITVEEQRNWITNMVYTGKVVQYIIWDKNDNKKIGSVYLQKFDEKRETCEFGILIGEEKYLGKGLGREANTLICDYAFEKLGVSKVYLRVLEKNTRAKQSYFKAGYVVDCEKSDSLVIDGKTEKVIFMSKERKNN